MSSGLIELYRMFGINPNPKATEKIVIKTDLEPHEEQMVNYLETGKLPTSAIALSHVDKLLAKDDM